MIIADIIFILGYTSIYLVLLLIFIIVGVYGSYFIVKKWFLKNGHLNSEQKHTAIIIYGENFKSKWYLILSGIDILVKYLKKNNEPYQVYFIENQNQFKSIVNNPKTVQLYICCHGARHFANLGSENIYYCELSDAPKKDFIAQLHCNHGGGKSLADYIAKNPMNCRVTNDVRHVFQNVYEIIDILNETNYSKKPTSIWYKIIYWKTKHAYKTIMFVKKLF